MFDNLKFTLADSNGKRSSTEFTTLGLISFLYQSKLLTSENAYSFLVFLANARPNDVYEANIFTIIVLPH